MFLLSLKKSITQRKQWEKNYYFLITFVKNGTNMFFNCAVFKLNNITSEFL